MSTSSSSSFPIDESTLPPYSSLPATTRSQWNRLADKMDVFHNHFRHSFKEIYHLADKFNEEGYDVTEFADFALSLEYYLSMHHNIEESYVFPALAKRMPQFRTDGDHRAEHKEMHKGLDKYADYLKACSKDTSKYKAGELRDIMDGFEKVLFSHLDAEVKSISGENMRKYWKLEELSQFPM